MENLNFKKMLKRAQINLVFALIISGVIIYFAVGVVQKDIFNHVVKEVDLQHRIMNNFVQSFQEEQESLIRMLSRNSELKQFAKENNNTAEIEKLFLSVVGSHKNIMQLRFIAINGDERFRIDQDNNSNISVISAENLQNKSDRYYVQDFLKLKEGEIGYSKFDLNVEHGKVETPFNPTLRMGEGVYIGGDFVGIVVINFYMQEWIQSALNFANVEIAMIDKSGFFLMHNDPEWRWSRYKETPRKALENDYIQELPLWTKEKKPFYKLSNYTIGKSLELFSDDVLVAYRLKKPIDTLIVEKILELSLMFLLAFLPVLLALLYLIYQYVQHTKQNAFFLEEIFNNIFDAIILINKDAIIQNVNNTTLDIFGYSQDELIGKNIKMLVPEPHKSLHDEYVKNYKQESRTIIGKQREIHGIHKDGSEIPVSLAVTKVYIDGEEYFIGSIRDLQEIKKLEAMTESQRVMLVNQSKLASMGEMIGAIAHQWRQPLNELSIRIQKLKYSYAQEEVDEAFVEAFIEKNKKTIEFMSHTIDDFRNFFRIDKQKQDFYVKEAINDVVSLQGAQLKHHNIELQVDGKEFSYHGLKTEFQQVIINLISNAKDAIVARNIQSPKIGIILQNNGVIIQDNAGGISDEILQRVFEPYFTTKEQGKGTGMGLYLSKMIIEKNMHGTIELFNKGDGTSVEIKLMENN